MNDNINVKMEEDQAPGLVLPARSSADADGRTVKVESRPSPAHKFTPTSHSPSDTGRSPQVKPEKQETVGGDITLKMEPGEPPKLSRKSSSKIPKREPPKFLDLPDATADATSTFEVMRDCHYAAKYMGYTEPPLECDCGEEWDSDCINRATKMECDPDCGCGTHCQNQRFQRKQYASVSVIKTEKKGFGLRANTDLRPNDFIFEYIGEVIGEAAFRRRMHAYDDEGIKHFYFMSLSKGEFVDATKKGNLGRFCNHSCNPNCYVDKWVVGEKLRMGIFAERNIAAGEELVFNYNVDRYGADPQPCYCGEPNCVGFIGGKQQSGRSTKLAQHVVEALGLEDADDWDTAVAKKPRKRKTGEDDEEYVNGIQPKELDQSGVRKVMATLATCKEKWIAVKLLDRIQESNDENIRFQVIRMHGYRILNGVLKNFSADTNVCQQVCDILSRFPMLTRNKIHDSGIEATMIKLAEESTDPDLKEQAQALNEKWSKLEMGFRIKKVKRDPNAVVEEKKIDRRDTGPERVRPRSRSRSPPSAPKAPSAPTGPRGNFGQRGPGFTRPPPPFRPRPQGLLPEGWFQAVAQNGSTYFYNATGQTTWQRPTQPALSAPPPPPPKAVSDQEVLQNLINSIINKKDHEKPSTESGEGTPNKNADQAKRLPKEERWKEYPEEKRKKLYENTLFPHIAYVMNKYKKHIDREDLKRFGKQIAKKLVDSDFKKGRVSDPRKKLDAKQEKVVKTYVKDFFDKAYQKQKERRKSESKADHKSGHGKDKIAPSPSKGQAQQGEGKDEDEDLQLSENEVEEDDDNEQPLATPVIPGAESATSKRQREDDVEDSAKRARTEDAVAPPPPPPPPPPPMTESPSDEMQLDTTPQQEHGQQSAVLEGIDVHAMDTAHPLTAVGDKSGQAQEFTPIQIATPPTTGSPDQDDRTGRDAAHVNGQVRQE